MDKNIDSMHDDEAPKVRQENKVDPNIDDKMDSLVDLDEFTQMGDEEDHESV